jgi:hypothetical protein
MDWLAAVPFRAGDMIIISDFLEVLLHVVYVLELKLREGLNDEDGSFDYWLRYVVVLLLSQFERFE